MNRRVFFQQCDADSDHQRMAGIASWTAFSARWRARQGLPLLHPMDVQYLTPQDFRTGQGRPLPPAEQRRLFRHYVAAALQLQASCSADHGMAVGQRPPAWSADIAFVRSDGFVRSLQFRQEVVYGRQDMEPYEPRALSPARPYGVPLTSEAFEAYWVDGSGLGGDEEW